MRGRGMQRGVLRAALGFWHGNCLILVLSFASVQGVSLKGNAVFCGVDESRVEAIGKRIAIERTLVFVRSLVMSLR